MIDYHIHTKLCGHARGEMEEYVERAIEIGLHEMGFSDHLPLLDRERPDLTMSLQQLPHYVDRVRELKDKYPQITIRLGIEADYFPHLEKQTAELLARYPFDYVIGSVHFLGDWCVDDPDEIQEWHRRGIDQVYETYLDLLQSAVESRLFDIIGHCDLPKIFGFRPTRDFRFRWQEIVRSFFLNRVAVEINTAGLRKPVGEIYPSRDILRLLKKYQIPIVFGSDAHAPQQVGMDLLKATKLVQRYGIEKVVQFQNRRIVKEISIESLL